MDRKRLLKYLRKAAEMAGKAGEGAVPGKDCYEDGQAFYSLLWYFDNCIADDLDAGDPSRYSPLLDAYLGADVPEVLFPPKIKKSQVRAEKEMLETLFPQSAYPLNRNQQKAVHKALHYPLSIIKGPPGTGKTETILRIVALTVASGMSVAVVSTNAAAVANVEEKVAAALERYGKTSLSEAEAFFGGDLAYLAACKHASLGDKKRREESAHPVTGANLAFSSGVHEFSGGARIGGWEQSKEFAEFMKELPFVTSTVHSLKKCFVDGDVRKYDLVIMDEASQTNLTVGIIAMSCARRMVLVGDEEQLPPVISDDYREAVGAFSKKLKLFKGAKADGSPYDISRDGLSFLTSCYEVFSDRNPQLRTMLTEHYRCHPAIIGFCNEEVYDRQLQVKTVVPEGQAPCPIRVRWYEGDYREGAWPPEAPREEEPNKKLRSTCVNRKQLAIMREEEAGRLLDLALSGESVCILSPFKGQIRLLESFVRQILKGRVSADAIRLEAGEEGEGATSEDVFTLTIHKSQGREFDVVYLLPVEDGNWEWPWSQGRRLVNVAASRAKKELCIVMSTKLMSPALQERLTGRQAYVRKPAKPADDPGNQQMFVRKLADYVDRTVQGLSGEDAVRQQDGEYGFRKSSVVSVFDDIPFMQCPKKKKDYRPELCVERALQESELRGVAYAKHVTFDKLLVGEGHTPLSELCEAEYRRPDQVHFDFVAYDPASRRVIMAIEVDGAHHRFKKSKGRLDLSVLASDDVKNVVVRDVCHATLSWLGLVRDGSLHPGNAAERGNRPDVRPLDDKSVSYRSGWGDWEHFPSGLQPTSAFVFLRIPSDGSTFWETDALRQAAREKGADGHIESTYPPPTIEDYIRSQRALFKKGEAPAVFVSEDVLPLFGEMPGNAGAKAVHFGNAGTSGAAGVLGGEDSGLLSISQCLTEWRKDPRLAALLEGVKPAEMNKRLVRAGYQHLEGGDARRRQPTLLGEKEGIVTVWREDEKGAYSFPQYSKKARNRLADRMEKIMRLDMNDV